MNSEVHNRQARKTRTAFLEAFNELALKRRYADIRVADIIRRADVGRSTFYEHFRNKDDLLRQSLSHVLSNLADAVGENCDPKKIQFILEHFRDNMRLARGLANGPSAPQVVTVLASLIEERLAASGQKPVKPGALPMAFVAAQIAESQLGLVRVWLNAGATSSSAAVAAALHGGSVALTRALIA
jgi:AcrR family transcriptional regulator